MTDSVNQPTSPILKQNSQPLLMQQNMSQQQHQQQQQQESQMSSVIDAEAGRNDTEQQLNGKYDETKVGYILIRINYGFGWIEANE